jgi:epoxyqueuosine reductase
MDAVISKISDEMKQHHYKFRTVSITHLAEVQDAVGNLVRQGMISEKLHSAWHFYKDNNTGLPEAKTIIIVAMPQYITRVSFRWQGKDYYGIVPPTYFTQTDDSCTEAILKEALEVAGYKMAKARLPLKTLAVRSGLAKYGRNNITYVPGMGSFHRLIVFNTDYPGTEDNWREPEMMKACQNCALCRDNCPTGSITSERFLIYAEKCLTHFNEYDLNLPFWLRPEWHNALIGCMSCQSVCPVNKPYLKKIENGPVFSEEETELILNRTPIEKLGDETRQKLDRIDYDEIYTVMGRNLRLLIEQQRNKDGCPQNTGRDDSIVIKKNTKF